MVDMIGAYVYEYLKSKTKLTKEDINLAPIWVKHYNILVVAYSEVCLS